MSIIPKSWARPDDYQTTIKADLLREVYFKDGYLYSVVDFILVEEGPSEMITLQEVPREVGRQPRREPVVSVSAGGNLVWHVVLARKDDRDRRVAIRYLSWVSAPEWQRVKNIGAPVTLRDGSGSTADDPITISHHRHRRGATRTNVTESHELGAD